MKKYIQIVLTLLSVFTLVGNVCAQDTNNIFLPEESRQFFNQTDVENKGLNAQSKAAAIKAGECRPAELDPDGHWGSVVGGFQLSIRSNTNAFIAGGSIPVSVIIRNTTTNTLLRFNADDGGESIFSIQDGAGHEVKQTMAGPGFSNVNFVTLAGNRQVKHTYDLNSQFHLEAGTYKIQVKQSEIIQLSDAKHAGTNVCSGILVIKVN